MQGRTKALIAAGALASVAALGTGAAVAANGGDDNSTPIAGTDLDQASAAALAHTHGGRVTATEVGDEESYYEVEVTLDNGNQVDVQLDKQFKVVRDKTESGEMNGDGNAGEPKGGDGDGETND